MPTRNVVLTEHQHEFVEELVETGRYQNASEVLREGLRLVEQRERREAARIAALRDAADSGWDDIDAGRYVDVGDEQLEDFIAQLGQQAAERVTAGNR
ncbi:MAG: type II toxin-antitoxin system ParD family antitoxin [Burkholderiaceae bacterium]|nr:type II toxin-antitoxin system ParD family antitoxin [Burkholderiaceae bacterium]